MVEALVNVIAHLCKAGVEGSIPFVSTYCDLRKRSDACELISAVV
ncbi:hypothetical protein C8D89_10475 [Actinomycetospora cinnamomea]|uniref:Uncharacterized protein n=2 Tax=Actinomycetospora cinnamomea TaxID=663609 RepID=A0A2U1FFA3_9PSEU|nr:hypothetical protein C8D89_10475 [Actinomycetospora cinnamomea]